MTPMPADDMLKLAERERMNMSNDTVWLIERRCTPPQWSTVHDPSGIGAFALDVQRAHRFLTKERAELMMRRMSITPEQRGQFFVSEHMWTGERAFFGMDEQDFEDFLTDAISDSLDMDWTSRDAAKAIIRALATPTETRP